jgi:protein-histidine pros-kinase
MSQSTPSRLSLAERLVEESPDALLALTLDGRIRTWNQGAQTIFGYTRDEAVGQSLAELLVPEEGQGDWAQAWRQVMTRGAVRLDAVRRRKDGAMVYVDVSMRRVDGPNEEPFVAVSTKDVTALKDLRDVQESEAKFRSLLEGAPDAIVIVDQSGRIVIVNQQTEQLFGYTRDELLGHPVEILIPEHLRGKHSAYRDEYFADPRVRPMGLGLELAGRRKDGSQFPVGVALSPLRVGGQMLFSSAIRDITARKQLERQMLEASRLKGEFLANMSHELRTPLNAIIGFAELMYREKVGPVAPAHKEYLGDILTSARHLLQLINDVLDLAKVESGKMEIRPERVDLAQLAEEVRDVLRGMAAAKRLTVLIQVDPTAHTATVDPARVKQILYNYLSNAIKFTGDQGRIDVSITSEGEDMFRIDVEDTGLGIAPENLRNLFVEFHQLDASAAKRYQGTGLGLALTKRIAEAHGGRVEVRSTLGAGSTFSAILPRAMGARNT